ncbi:MAG: hypothetical protein GY803_10445 [Chloroflexi bacterium]|nr:hypothetical protein [Chloroflexota bacterium]
MNTERFLNRLGLLVLLGALAFLVLTFVQRTTADGYELPPRGAEPNNASITYAHGKESTDGARLQIHALFSESWPWDEMHWQNVWTTIQWADNEGTWHDVAGWQGGLDAIIQEEAGWVGTKEWWAGEQVLGTGPYRWKIYQSAGGTLLVASQPFYLPESAGSTLVLQPVLEPK